MFHLFHYDIQDPGGGVLYIFSVRGRAIGKGIDFHDFGIRNGIDFHDFGIRNGINFRNFHNWYIVVYAFSENWYKGSVIQHGTEGGGRDYKNLPRNYAAQCKKKKLFTKPLNICKNDLMTPWLQHELCGLESSSRKFSALYDSVFLPMHHAAITYLRDPV